ncbi:MAG: hypothetical protein IJ184_06465 [Alphaproteobacteria bacterium]|nr:hypothetical protein [Alphaproteobacteria bacterium]
MKKIGLFLFLLLFASGAYGQYMRKLREPDFFIPEADKMHKQEKIPEFKLVVKEKQAAENNNSKTEAGFEENSANIKVGVVKLAADAVKNTQNVAVGREDNIKKSLYDIKGVPEYKNKYNQYIDDIMTFYNEGKMPENEKLQKDLAAMSSSDNFEVTDEAPKKLTSQEMAEFYKIYQDIIKQ